MGYINIVRLLINSTPTIIDMRANDGSTALHYASNIEVVRELIYHNANVNAQDEDGLTLLHFASRHNNIALATELLCYCDSYVIDNHGKRAIDVAKTDPMKQLIQSYIDGSQIKEPE
jgi:ankyrin repeat protein